MMMRTFCIALGICFSCSVWAGQATKDMPRQVLVNGVEFAHIPGGWVSHPIPDIDPVTIQSRREGRREVRVWVDGYYMALYEARARDFMRFMSEGDPVHRSQYDSPPSHVTGSGAVDGCSLRKNDAGYYLTEPKLDLPVTHLSWDLADEFSRWMGFRLPTEAEWVRAFRGDTKNIFPWGNEFPDDTYAGFQEGATECNVQSVTAFPKGRSPYGIHNMAGNVYEYVADWFNLEYYDQLKNGARNPVSTESYQVPNERKPYRILRGGRWASGVGELHIFSNRDLRATDEMFRCYGARFAIDEAAVKRHLEAGTAKVLQ